MDELPAVILLDVLLHAPTKIQSVNPTDLTKGHTVKSVELYLLI